MYVFTLVGGTLDKLFQLFAFVLRLLAPAKLYLLVTLRLGRRLMLVCRRD